MARAARGPYPIIQIVLALGVGCVAAAIPLSCGGSQGIPLLARCQLTALRALPTDPMMATVYDAVDVIERLRACKAELGEDGGAP